MTTPAFEANTSLVKSLVAAMKKLGHFERVSMAASPALKQLLENPSLQKWWPGALLSELLHLLGSPASREVNIRASNDGMVPLAKGFAGVLLSFSKTPVLSLLSRIDAFAALAARGMEIKVVPTVGQNAVTITFVLPEPVAPQVADVWFSMINEGIALTKTGKVARETVLPTSHTFELEW